MPGKEEWGLTLEMLAYIRVFDMGRYCQELAPLMKDSHPELSKKMERAAKSFQQWLKEIETHGCG